VALAGLGPEMVAAVRAGTRVQGALAVPQTLAGAMVLAVVAVVAVAATTTAVAAGVVLGYLGRDRTEAAVP
jgi:hypothetical protein